MNHPRSWSYGLLVFLVAGSWTLADSPASAVNPQNNAIEIADPTWTGTNLDIDYVIDSGNGEWPDVISVTDNPLNDNRPQLALAANGDARVVWWRDDTIDLVLVRKRHFSDESWDAERVLSDPANSSRNPMIAYDGTNAWVAYEFDDGSKTGIGVTIIVDDPDPVGLPVVIGDCEFAGSVNVAIHASGGHLWTTWVDSASDVAWAEYDYASETWSLPSFEPYAQDSIRDALERVLGHVVD